MSALTDLYGALATVAAITTAIQTSIALDAFNKCSEKVALLDPTDKHEAAYGNVIRERVTFAWQNGLPNIPPNVVNAFVLIPWGYLVYNAREADVWLYFLPWLGVAIVALFLFLLVVTSILALWTRWVRAALASVIVGSIAIWLMLAGEYHIWPF